MNERKRNEAALKYLRADEMLHIGMIYPILRGSADIICASVDGVLLRERVSGAYMLACADEQKGREMLDSVGPQPLFCMCQRYAFEYVREKYGLRETIECHQAVYSGAPALLSGALKIEALDIGRLDVVRENYDEAVSLDYLRGRLDSGEIFGGFLRGEPASAEPSSDELIGFASGELVGFAGMHEEGSIGLLVVRERFRRRGFARELEGFLINRELARGRVPFAQIAAGNTASLALHKRLGFEISRDCIYWAF